MQYSNFVFREDWYRIIRQLPPDTFLEVMDTICRYVFEGIEPNLDTPSIANMAVQFIIKDIQADKDKYNTICERRAEAGRKGGQRRVTQANQANASFASINQANQAKPSKRKQTEAKPSKSSEALFEIKDKDKDRDIGENNDFFFSSEKGSEDAAEKKEKEIEEISLCYLSDGKPNAYNEAEAFYNYNSALCWERTICRKDGTEVKQRIRDRVAYGKGWKTKSEQCFAPADGALMASIVRDIGYDKDIVNAFRGFRTRDGTEILVLFANDNACRKFGTWVGAQADIDKFFAAVTKQYSTKITNATPQLINNLRI